MAQKIFPARERGKTRTDWLTSYHLFSFGNWDNPERRGFGSLRVFNEDRVRPKTGFGLHSHDNMEIISIVLDGQLEHLDTTGNQGVLVPGDIQVMSAGSGIRHAERNPSHDRPARFLQIWIHPDKPGYHPSYHQIHVGTDPTKGFKPIVSDGTIPQTAPINADATISMAYLLRHETVVFPACKPHRGLFLYVVEGKITWSDCALEKGDSLQCTEIKTSQWTADVKSTVVLIDVPIH